MGDREGLLVGLDGTVAAPDDGDARRAGRGLGLRLVTDATNGLFVGPDELDVVRAADLGEVRVLRQEAVAGVDRVDVGDLRRGDDVRDRQIGLRARTGPDADGLVGELEVRAPASACE